MSTNIHKLILFAAMVWLDIACQRGNSDPVEPRAQSATAAEYSIEQPCSLAHFKAAEQHLADGRYIYAATQLDKGIVAFRIETGKLSGPRAARANRSIDVLTKLRKTLRHGEAIPATDLHLAILTAMESEPFPATTHPSPDPGLFVPVNGH